MHRKVDMNAKPKDFLTSIKRLFKDIGKYKVLLIISFVLAMVSAILAIIGPHKISDLTNEIQAGLIIDRNKLELVYNDIYLSENDFAKITNDIINNQNISLEDKSIYFNMISNNEMDIKKIPLSIKEILLPGSYIDSVYISTNDKIDFITAIGSLNKESKNIDIYKAIDNMPSSIKELIKPKINLDIIKNIVLLLGIIYVVSAIFNYVQAFIMQGVSNHFARNLRKRLSLKINKLPLRYFDNHSIGDSLSRVTNDVDTIEMAMNNSMSSLMNQITLVIGSLIMMFYTNIIMAIGAILSSLVGFLFMGIIMKNSQKYFHERQKALGKLDGHIEEIYRSLNVVKAYNGEKDAKEKFDNYNNEVYNANFKSQFLGGLMPPLMMFIGNLSYVVVCIIGAVLVINNQITFGTIMSFIIYIRLFTNPLSQLAQGFTSLQSAAAASERVYEYLDEEELPDESHIQNKLALNEAQGNINFSHVLFGYNKDKIIIKDFNSNISKGMKVAIVGPTGAGKTTLVNLLMKFYDLVDGDILIDNKSIKNLTRENIHDLFIMVLQDTWLFNGTIRDNIKYNKENVTDEEIWEALKVVGVDHFVKSLPGMLDYEITERDVISSGEKQLLTIARGMIKDAPFLILDEATSSVDTRTEELVQKAMDKLTIGRTSFIIAHRLSTIKNADLILVMNDGNIVEQGTHDELIKKNGFYADLYNSQFSN